MFDTENLVLWVVGLLATAGLVLWLRRHFSPSAREQRRRDLSHRRVVSKAKHPIVRLAVQTEKPKRKLKG